MAQSVEHVIGNDEVISSILITSSKKIPKADAFGIFLSKPQAWHIIAARSVVHIISPFGAVSHHAPACIYLRLDSIPPFGRIPYRNKLRIPYTATP